jgi:hypothetical protein
MRTKPAGDCKSPQNIRTWSGVLGRLSRLLAGRKNTHTNIEEYVEARYVLPYMLP